MIFPVKNFWSCQKFLVTLICSYRWFEATIGERIVEKGGVLEVPRACDRFPSKFQNFERHCSKTALDEKKWGIPAVPLKMLKLAWEPIAGPWDLQNPPHFRLFSIQWWPQIIDRSKSKWPKIFVMTKNFLTEKVIKISSFYFGPGSPKNWFLRFFQKCFTKKWAGIRESRVRRRAPGNHEWDDDSGSLPSCSSRGRAKATRNGESPLWQPVELAVSLYCKIIPTRVDKSSRPPRAT